LSDQHKQKIAQFLAETHALELALARHLEAQISMTPRSSYRDGLEDHLRETRGHAARLAARLDELRWDVDLRQGGGEERVLRSAWESCAAEAQEIATYTALARLARRAGDARTGRMVASILVDERRMLDRLLKAIPRLTDAAVRAALDGDDPYGARAATSLS
jgi:ferritin-like metal-binding protein YciE